LLVFAMFIQYAPVAVAVPSASKARKNHIQEPRGKRAFGRTAQKGAFSVKAVRESGEYGGALTPATEDTSAFSTNGNEAFGTCMQLWNKHRWTDAADAMQAFITAYPEDPWAGEAELHIACYHKYRHEYRQAEEILIRLYEQNISNPVGRKALIRLGHLYFETFRYQKAEEAYQTLLEMNPIEEEKSYAINWLFHIQRAWTIAAFNRECGPKSFGYAAWLTEHAREVVLHREAEISRRSKYRKDKSFPAYMPGISFNTIAGQYPWATETMPENGASLADIRTLLKGTGLQLKLRHVSYEDLISDVSENQPVVLCLSAPQDAKFIPPTHISEISEQKKIRLREHKGGQYNIAIGHYVVLLKATKTVGWVLDSERGVVQWPAQRIKELWAAGQDKGLVAWVVSGKHKPAFRKIDKGKTVPAAVEQAFRGGCCGAPPQNDDNGCGGAGGAGGSDGPKGMPDYGVNIYNLNYLITDIPIWCETPRGPELNLTLTYNNRESNSARYPIEDVQFYPFGFRWSGSHDGRYYFEPNDDTYLVHFPNGMEVYFYDQDEDGTYYPDSRYIDHLDFNILTNGAVRVDLKKGLMSYYFHPINTAMQQTLYRMEDRFGDGIDIARDGDTNSLTYGCILYVESDGTGTALNYQYDNNGNVTNVYETASASATGRKATFTYEAVGTNSRLKSMTDMGGYTTAFEYGSQTYSPSFFGSATTSDHHVLSYTWPNGGVWEFDLRQHRETDYEEPLQLTVTDPKRNTQTYYYQALHNGGPLTAQNRNGVGSVESFGEVGNVATYSCAELVNSSSIYSTSGEYRECMEMAANGRDVKSKRTLLDRKSGGAPINSYAAYNATSDTARKDLWYGYESLTNGNRIITLTNEVYQSVTGTVQKTDQWVELIEQDANYDAVRIMDKGTNTVYLDRTNRLVSAVRILPNGGTEKTVYQATYNDHGQLLTYTVDEGLQNIVSNVYDSAGLLSTVHYPDGTSESFGYDSETFFMTGYTNRTGQAVETVPDEMGRPLDIIYADGTTNWYDYGCCAAEGVTDRHGITSHFGYDANKQLDWATFPMNEETDTHMQFDYMGEGELKSIGYGSSMNELATRTFDYYSEDGATRLKARNTPEGKTPKEWTYTFCGLPETLTDGRGVVTEYTWDAGRELLKQKAVDGLAAGLEDVDVVYQYDAQDRPTNVVKTLSTLGEIWRESYVYDNRSRLETVTTKIQNIPGQTSALEYTLDYDYGPRGFVTNRTLTVGGANVASTAYTYDLSAPRIVQVSDDFATANYTYDQYGRLETQTNTISGVSSSKTVKAWSYDTYSRMDSLTVSNSTALLWGNAYGYDVDRITAITNLHDSSRWNYAYDYQGQLTGSDFYTSSNTIGHVERYQYDAAGNMVHKGIAGGGADIQLIPNADDEIASLERHKTVTLVGHLSDTNAVLSLPLGEGAPVQDEHGNWIAPLLPLHPMSNGNVRIQLKAEVAGENDTYKLADFTVNPTSTNLSYDANGSLLTLSDGGTNSTSSALSWNAEGRLASATNDTSTGTYYYDDNGRRIAKIENGTLELYVWEGMNIIGTADEDADVTEYYTRGIGIAGDVGTLVATHRFSDASTVLLHNNHRGDVILATDSTGTAIGKFEYTPFGNQKSSTGSYTPRFGFSSKEFDVFGLVYYGFRYYSPELFRWISLDPFNESGGYNLYRFCSNNPINYLDPDGQMAEAIAIGIGVGISLPSLPALIIGGAVVIAVIVIIKMGAEHVKNKRPSNRPKHEKGNKRRGRDGQGEKGDRRRPYRVGGKLCR